VEIGVRVRRNWIDGDGKNRAFLSSTRPHECDAAQRIETCTVDSLAERAYGDGEPQEKEPVERNAADNKERTPDPCAAKTSDDAGPVTEECYAAIDRIGCGEEQVEGGEQNEEV
jgi:hypothetical protein